VIRHLVLWRLATDDPAEKARTIAELTERFAALVPIIDGVERLDIRADLGETAGNWDVVLDSDYRDEAALAAYQVHPDHVAVTGFIASVVRERACIDFSG
jgi:hypothetical protein